MLPSNAFEDPGVGRLPFLKEAQKKFWWILFHLQKLYLVQVFACQPTKDSSEKLENKLNIWYDFLLAI